MKSIIFNSMWAHLMLFFFICLMVISSQNLLLLFGGVLYVLIIFSNAMEIAEFQMSKKGEFIANVESRKYKKCDVIFYE